MTVSHPFPDIINRQNHSPSPVVEADDDDDGDDTDRITNNNNNNDFVVASEEPVMGLAMDYNSLDNNQTSCLRRRRKTIFVLGVVVFIMAIVGSLAGVLSNDSHSTSPNTEEEDTHLLLQRQSKDMYYRNLQKAVVRHVYRGKYQPSVFLTPNTPQLQAMQWMAYIDTLQFPLQTMALTNDNEAVSMKRALLQRYVLMTLLFSNRGVLVDADVEEGTGGTKTYDLDRYTNNNSTSLGEKNTTVWTPEQGIGLDECEWAFVECDGQGRLTTLQLAEYYIKDSLPREIGLLHRLKHLDLSDNSWQGRLPNELYDLTHLESLNLSDNQFGGSISSHIGRLQKLKNLVIATNSFTGTVPSTLQALTNLETFHMGVNPLLGGPVLSLVTADTMSHTLMDLDVSETATSGTIPTEVGRLTKLTNLKLWLVPLSGTIPSEIGTMKSLNRLQWGFFFDVGGTLPTEVGLMTNLDIFDLKETSLSGSIPSEIGTLTNTRAFLFRESRRLRGSIPSEVGLMKALEVFQVANTDIRGTIPTELGLLENAFDMRFFRTELSGTVPDEICKLNIFVVADCLPYHATQPEVECDDGCCTCIDKNRVSGDIQY